MTSSLRLRYLALSSLVFAIGAGLVAACAESDEPSNTASAKTDGGKKDAASSGDDDDDDDDGDDDIDSGKPEDDGGSSDDDSGTDAGKTDAGQDSGEDAGKDSGTDAGQDSGTDAGTDSGTDAGTDAGQDAGPVGDKPAQGEVVISEVMFDPETSEDTTEWFELHNTTAVEKDLSGLVIKDGNDRTHAIKAGTKIAAGAYVVFAKNMAGATGVAKIPAASVVYDYGAGTTGATILQFANNANGAVALFDGATELARGRYGALGLSGSSNGKSIQLKVLTYPGSGVKENWCRASTAWAGGDLGTPGQPNNCP